jgi:hypothetical protein
MAQPYLTWYHLLWGDDRGNQSHDFLPKEDLTVLMRTYSHETVQCICSNTQSVNFNLLWLECVFPKVRWDMGKVERLDRKKRCALIHTEKWSLWGMLRSVLVAHRQAAHCLLITSPSLPHRAHLLFQCPVCSVSSVSFLRKGALQLIIYTKQNDQVGKSPLTSH